MAWRVVGGGVGGLAVELLGARGMLRGQAQASMVGAVVVRPGRSSDGVEHVVPHGKRRGAESLVIGTRRVMERGRAHLQQDDISIEGDEHTEDIDPPDVPNSMHPPHVEADAGVVEHVEGDDAQPAGANWRHRVRREDRVGVLHPRESDHTG